MPEAPDLQGMLDLSKAKPKDYVKLPEALAGITPRSEKSSAPLFSAPPEFTDIMPLAKAKPADGSLFECFASLLGGLPSGPAQVMGMFRSVGESEVVIRLFLPKRPRPSEKPQPMYFRVQRGHAELAIRNKWVGPGAPTWLALFASVYYAYIKDRQAYYERKDLGGADNAAWLLLFGKDSGRADYPDSDSEKPGRAAKTGGGGGPALAPSDVQKRVLGLSDPAADSKFCAECIFDEEKGAGPLTKEWMAWVSKAKPTPDTDLRAGLTPQSVGKLGEVRKWLEQPKGLSNDVRWRLLLFLEANGVSTDDKERYPKETQRAWDEIGKTLRKRAPVALVVRSHEKGLLKLADNSEGVLEVVETQALELPSQKGPRGLRYLLVRTDPAQPGRRFCFEADNGVQILRAEPSKKALYWLELEHVMRSCAQILGGAPAAAALAQGREESAFTIEVAGPQRIKFV
jgi:hypothetical protein